MPLWDVVQKSTLHRYVTHQWEEAGQTSSLSCLETRPRNGGRIMEFNLKISPSFSMTKNSSLITAFLFPMTTTLE